MRPRTLQGKFRLWTVLLVVLPSILISTIYSVGQIVVAKQEKLEQISQRVDFQRRLIEYWVEERSNDVHNLSRMEAFRNLDERQMRSTLAVMQQSNKDFDSLSFIDKQGMFKMSTLNSGVRFPVAINQPYYQAAKAGKTYISDIVIGRNSGLPIINFSSPIYDGEGMFLGLILGSVQTKQLEKLLRDNWIGQTGEIILVNRDALLIAEPRYTNTTLETELVETTSKKRTRLSADFLANIHLGETGSDSWTDDKGNKVMGAYQYIPERSWTLIGSISENEIITPIYTQLKIMVGGMLVLVLLILPLATMITNQIKRPVECLIEQSNLVAEGNYEKIDLVGCLRDMPYELSKLLETFLNMSQRVENTVGLLKENESNLENKVIEIQNINRKLIEEVAERQSAQEALQELNADLEGKVLYRTSQLQEINAALQKEIMERQLAQEVLEKMSITDALTGLNNHRYIMDYLEKKIAESNRYNAPLSVAMLDLDYFKKVNDGYGHLEGDNVLRGVAECLKANIRNTDALGRYGGEEFVLVFPHTNREQAFDLTERLRVLVSELRIGDKQISITISGGIAEYLGESLTELMRRADQSLYQAKTSGRNRIVKNGPSEI